MFRRKPVKKKKDGGKLLKEEVIGKWLKNGCSLYIGKRNRGQYKWYARKLK